MSDTSRKFVFTVLLFAMLLAAGGCAGSEDGPSLISAYPASRDYTEHFDPLPKAAVVVYHAMVDLQVRSVADAADEIKHLAHEYSGYVTNAQIWHEDREEHASLVVSVPVYNFDLLHAEILRLGTLQRETVSGELDTYPDYGRDEMVMSTITVLLSERSSVRLPEFPNWRAANTFEQAFGVAAAIFRFLLDAAIWIVVVLGPFALIGWGVRTWWLRRQKPQTEEEKPEPSLDKEK